MKSPSVHESQGELRPVVSLQDVLVSSDAAVVEPPPDTPPPGSVSPNNPAQAVTPSALQVRELDLELFEAAARGDAAAVRAALAEGANPDFSDVPADIPESAGVPDTPLHFAAAAGFVDIVVALLEGGAAIEGLDRGLYTPLERAVASGRVEVVSLLLASGASPTPPLSAVSVQAPLFVAAACGNAVIVAQLLAAGASAASADCSGVTPLHVAGTPAIAEALLAAGADADARMAGAVGGPWVLTPEDWHRIARAFDIVEAISAFRNASRRDPGEPGGRMPPRATTLRHPAAGCNAVGLWVGPRAVSADRSQATVGCALDHPLRRNVADRLRRKRCAAGRPGAVTSRPLLLCRVASEAIQWMFPAGGGCPVPE